MAETDLKAASQRALVLARVGDEPPAGSTSDVMLKRFAEFRDPSIGRAEARARIAHVTEILMRGAAGHLPAPDLLVPIARAGAAMLEAADAHFAHPEIAFAIARKTKGTTHVDVALSTGPAERHRRVLLLDTVSATGDTVVRVAEAMAQRVPTARIDVALCYASPTAMDLVRGCAAIDRIALAILSDGVDPAGWLLPKINGDAGDKLYGRPS